MSVTRRAAKVTRAIKENKEGDRISLESILKREYAPRQQPQSEDRDWRAGFAAYIDSAETCGHNDSCLDI